MIELALLFLFFAILAGVFGFGGLLIGTAMQSAQILFFVFLILAAATLLFGARERKDYR